MEKYKMIIREKILKELFIVDFSINTDLCEAYLF